jgi:large subunit ribosomal protein L32
MPNPKRRHSAQRRAKRRAHEPKLPHRVCPHCGQYKGREVIEVGEE